MPLYRIKDAKGEAVEEREAASKFEALAAFARPHGGHVQFASYVPVTVGLSGAPHKAERVAS